MNFAILMAAMAAAPLSALAGDFSGTWKGSGHWANGTLEQTIETSTTVTITATATAFRFVECWDYRDHGGTPRHTCIDSSYDRDANDALFHAGKRVGDVFPDWVRIYDGNTQVGEQIMLQMVKNGQLRYRYSYVNFDGASEWREALLSLAL